MIYLIKFITKNTIEKYYKKNLLKCGLDNLR